MDRIKTIENIMLEVLEKLTKKNNNFEEIIEEIAHMYGVASMCKILALRRNLNSELAVIIGLMHDIGRTKLGDDGKNHSEKGAKESKDIIKELNMFDKDEIEIIYKSILKHSFKKEVGNEYQELIKDADVFEKFLRTPEDINKTEKQKRVNTVKNELSIT